MGCVFNKCCRYDAMGCDCRYDDVCRREFVKNTAQEISDWAMKEFLKEWSIWLELAKCESVLSGYYKYYDSIKKYRARPEVKAHTKVLVAEWAKKHRERRREQAKAYKEAHREEINARARARRAAKKNKED